MKIIDTHAHYDDHRFDADREEILRILPESGIETVVNMGADMEGSENSAALSQKYPYIYAGIGIHPDEVGVFEHPEEYLERKIREVRERETGQEKAAAGEAAGDGTRNSSGAGEKGTGGSSAEASDNDGYQCFTVNEKLTGIRAGAEKRIARLTEVYSRCHSAADALERITELCRLKKTVVLGEIGLDYHWMIETKEVQRRWFCEQLSLARELGLPVNIHSRDAAQDTFDILKEFSKANPLAESEYHGIVHSYSASVELAREYVKMGWMLGIGGVVTFKNARVLKNVVTEIPIDYLVTETDSPYMAPTPNRGKRNDSRNIRYVIEKIAELKGMEPEACAEILRRNAEKVYRKLNFGG